MSRNTENTFEPMSPTSGGGLLAYVVPNGGSVRVQVPCGDQWVDLFTMTASGATLLQIYRCRFRVVPAGGAFYALHA